MAAGRQFKFESAGFGRIFVKTAVLKLREVGRAAADFDLLQHHVQFNRSAYKATAVACPTAYMSCLNTVNGAVTAIGPCVLQVRYRLRFNATYCSSALLSANAEPSLLQ